MIGAILGDIIGSRFQLNPIKHKNFKLFTDQSTITDDTIMTLAIGKAVKQSKNDFKLLSKLAVKYMQELYTKYPDYDYGLFFLDWLKSNKPKPYNSYGNGAPMRVSACGIYHNTLEDVLSCSDAVTKVSHNHPDSIKAARATAESIFLARKGKSKEEIKIAMLKYYHLDTTLDILRPNYKFNSSSSYTMPAALICFFESTSLIDAIRNAVSLGGDSDTLGAITGSIAKAYYGIEAKYVMIIESYLFDDELLSILKLIKSN